MTGHALTKSAIFYSTGHAAQKAGSQRIDRIEGLRERSPALGWALMLGALAIVGVPPFGVFASEFLILTQAMQVQPWATPILLLALGVAFGAIFLRVQGMVFGAGSLRRLPHQPWMLPAFVHMGLVLMLGLWVPDFLASWWRAAAAMIGGGA
jgi:hydrogenase-4 component F